MALGIALAEYIQDGVRRRDDKIFSFVLLYNTKFMKKLKFDVSVIKNKNNTMDCTHLLYSTKSAHFSPSRKDWST